MPEHEVAGEDYRVNRENDRKDAAKESLSNSAEVGLEALINTLVESEENQALKYSRDEVIRILEYVWEGRF